MTEKASLGIVQMKIKLYAREPMDWPNILEVNGAPSFLATSRTGKPCPTP